MPDHVFTDFTPADEWRGRQQDGTLWIAERDGVPVAFLGAHVEAERLHIDEFAVAAEHQGQGLGRRMLDAVAAWAREHGVQRLSLTTFRSVPFNARFYAAYGFRDWPEAEAPPSVRQRLMYEAGAGLNDRCAMVMEL